MPGTAAVLGEPVAGSLRLGRNCPRRFRRASAPHSRLILQRNSRPFAGMKLAWACASGGRPPEIAGGRMRRIRVVFLVAAALANLFVAEPCFANSRIKDIVQFEGVRTNKLIGYGLVVGLNGTGDSLRN